MNFYDHLNNAEKYLCDKCNVVELREDEYLNNWKPDNTGNNTEGFRYCQECWCYIHLQYWTDIDGNKHTLRSERILIHD